MTGYQVKTEAFLIGNISFDICTLLDRQQFYDPDGVAERMGISSATWPLFGLLWPSGLILADKMSHFPIAGKRILEVGCGIALASIVIRKQGGDITATDYHPMAQSFLENNARLNRLPPVLFQMGDWAQANPLLGKFDLIIGSDVLYEQEHPENLCKFIQQHAAEAAEVVIVDPGRGHRARFSKKMLVLGFTPKEEYAVVKQINGVVYKAKVSHYERLV